MSGKRYSDEFKAEAAKQVIDQGRSVREVSTQLGGVKRRVGNIAPDAGW